MSANDRQEGGDHYKKLKPEPWDVIVAWELGYLDGAAVKYLARWRHKHRGDLPKMREDLLKARHFIDKQIEVLSEAIAVEVVG